MFLYSIFEIHSMAYVKLAILHRIKNVRKIEHLSIYKLLVCEN